MSPGLSDTLLADVDAPASLLIPEPPTAEELSKDRTAYHTTILMRSPEPILSSELEQQFMKSEDERCKPRDMLHRPPRWTPLMYLVCQNVLIRAVDAHAAVTTGRNTPWRKLGL